MLHSLKAHYIDQYIGKNEKPTPRKNVCACVNVAYKCIANLMRSCSERFRRLKMVAKSHIFIIWHMDRRFSAVFEKPT